MEFSLTILFLADNIMTIMCYLIAITIFIAVAVAILYLFILDKSLNSIQMPFIILSMLLS